MAGAAIFLTGATGNIGGYVVSELVRRGAMVTALVRRPMDLDGCRTVIGELATADRLAAEIAAADGVIHLASARALARSSVMRHEIVGTSLLINAWRKGPFIYASDPSIHGVPRGTLKENSPVALDLDEYTWYELGKLCNEFQLRLAERGLSRGPAISLRPGIFFTASDRRHDRQWLSLIYPHCQRGTKFVFDSKEGLETYGTSFIGGVDFSRAVADALGIKISGAYNVAGGFCTWSELIATINRFAGTRADFVIRSDTRPQAGEYRLLQSRTHLDTSAFAAQTGFIPRQSLEELVEEFVRAERHTRPA